jgi:uroporphyrin-III C-methyltransferase
VQGCALLTVLLGVTIMTDSSSSIITITSNNLSNKSCNFRVKDKPLGIEKNVKMGTVHLVGAGSGDPELLTLKALRIMQKADVVLYDSLVSEDILDMCALTAEKVFVGKRRANHAIPQEGINELLVKHALAGKTVVRLKGGDPFIFGRGGEELQEVVRHGIRFESIPGITAASAAASRAGIPLTHRDYAQSVKFVTACKKSGAPNNDYYEHLDSKQTVVFYMGLNRLYEMTQGLIAAGRDSNTPFAVISHASLPTQQLLIGTLGSIANQQAVAKLPTPALLIMGNVVTLYHEFASYNLGVLGENVLIDVDEFATSKVLMRDLENAI